ncbi:alpha/beta fold hydrolase [Kibdelosporangium aridum]|uniref:alpha/beta fold hydrolase n=1 Tax=Kibdelosporangium aridum TaxID=2030 RepID=UPI001C8B7AED|nr:alpha/beta hydrolase [Kibdelosporangium aridum]
MTPTVRTSCMEIAYQEEGNPQGTPVVLVHGWPDDVSCWDLVVPLLADDETRIIRPYLRGTGPTRFLAGETLRSGQIGALGRDLADFLDALALREPLIVGHDWGARTGYVVASLYPERLSGLVAMSAGYATTGAPLPYSLAHAYWYEWFVATGRGRTAMREDRRELCRYLWSN